MNRFMKMTGMLIVETTGFIGAIYTMLWLTSMMYYNDIIMERSILDSVTNALGGIMLGLYIFLLIFTVLTTAQRCVYEKGTREI